MSQPVFEYVSRCCTVRAQKEPCTRTQQEKKDREWGKHTLGTWRCPKCGHPCAVSRQKPEAKGGNR